MARVFDGNGQFALVRAADARFTPCDKLSPLGHKLRKHADVFKIRLCFGITKRTVPRNWPHWSFGKS